MAVLLTVSDVALDGAAASDSLAGGGTGVDLGSVVNGSYAPIGGGGPADNSGRQDIWIRHDATIDPITDVKTFIQTFGVGTGFTYGGADSAANDIVTMLDTLGDNSGESKNNADDLSGGLWIDMDTDVTTINQFDFATNGIPKAGNDTVEIYGRGGGTTNGAGSDLANAIDMAADAMVIDSDQSQGGDGTNGYIPTAPELGKIGKDGDTALGDNAHIGLRIQLLGSFTNGGIVQWEWVAAYSFTAALAACFISPFLKLVEVAAPML